MVWYLQRSHSIGMGASITGRVLWLAALLYLVHAEFAIVGGLGLRTQRKADLGEGVNVQWKQP